MPNILFVMAGGAIGAALRYGLGRALPPFAGSGWPTATLTVNILGGLLMGILSAVLVKHGPAEPWRLFAGVGILGGFTTFSAFSMETMMMIESDRWGAAIGYAGLSVAGSVAALALGMAMVRAL